VDRRRATFAFLISLAGVLAWTTGAGAGGRNWAAPEIRAVTQAGVLGSSPATFAPQSPLTQRALAAAITAADGIQHPPPPSAPKPEPLALLSTLPADAVVAGTAHLEVQVPGHQVDHVDFAVDGIGVRTEQQAPYALDMDTHALADGTHQLAVNAVFSGGGYAVAVWTITVANAPGAVLTPLVGSVALPIAKSWLPAPAPQEPVVHHALYRAAAPSQPVTIKQLDAALVAYLGLGGAAREIQLTLQGAGLRPQANTGTEAVARMLQLRLNHPSGQDDLELLPFQPATRAEAAWSFAQVMRLDQWAVDSVQHAADTFTLPELTTWQQQILRTGVQYVGYPYVLGDTSQGAESLFAVRSAGGRASTRSRGAPLQASLGHDHSTRFSPYAVAHGEGGSDRTGAGERTDAHPFVSFPNRHRAPPVGTVRGDDHRRTRRDGRPALLVRRDGGRAPLVDRHRRA